MHQITVENCLFEVVNSEQHNSSSSSMSIIQIDCSQMFVTINGKLPLAAT